MPATIQTVCALPDLGLRLVAGHAHTDRVVRWVHVSETVDPTQWLRGGELLLTTGLQVENEAEFEPYIRRLATAGLAGMGFGIGLRWDQIPQTLLDTAEETGLPVIEIPYKAPWVAISEAVSRIQSDERLAATDRALEGQRALTGAAIAGGAAEVVRECGRRVAGWTVLTDPVGQVLHESETGVREHVVAVLPDLHRARERGGGTSSVVRPDGSAITIYPLVTQRSTRAILVAGLSQQPQWADRVILQGAAALLTLEVERMRGTLNRLHRLRADTLGPVLRGTLAPGTARRQVAKWGLDPTSVRVCVLRTAPQRVNGLYQTVVETVSDPDRAGGAVVMGTRGESHVAVLVGTAQTLTALEQLVRDGREGPEGREGREEEVWLGEGDVVDFEEVLASYEAAQHAAEIGASEGRPVTRFDELGALQLILRGQPAPVVQAFVRSVLGPLDRDEPGQRAAVLRETLRAFLQHNGHWNDTATALGIHRHTLRGRIDRIEQLTGRSLSSAYDRMELWMSLLAQREP